MLELAESRSAFEAGGEPSRATAAPLCSRRTRGLAVSWDARGVMREEPAGGEVRERCEGRGMEGWRVVVVGELDSQDFRNLTANLCGGLGSHPPT